MSNTVCRMMVIDDNADDRADLRQMLLRGSTKRYRFTDAELGVSALQMIHDAQAAAPGDPPFDCILLDFHLPDIDAHRVLMELCAGSHQPPCPVVVITGWNGVDDADCGRLLRAGAQDYIGKSWTTPESLTRSVVNAIERYELMRQRNIEAARLCESEQKLKEQTEALAEADRRKDEFLAMLSHELRNPLGSISNAVYLLQKQKAQDPIHQQAHAVIDRQVRQLNHLVNDLLEVSRITTGRVLLRKARIAFGTVLERSVETVQTLMTQLGHRLEVVLPQQPVWLLADGARLEQVVVNLLINAAKFTEPGGRIELTMRLDGASAVLKVSDNGIGIPPELLPDIFQMFKQAERSLDRSQGGLGIGLCLVQRLVELHGGAVMAQSIVGQGSEFTVRLPSADAPALALTPLPELAAHTTPAQKGHRVLVVDDNLDAAESLAMLLTFNGHEVRVANDGPSALASAIEFMPDAIALDIGLPGLDGYETARQIRRHVPLRRTVLIALTGYGQELDHRRSREAGFDHHLVKPANLEELENILKKTGPAETQEGAQAS